MPVNPLPVYKAGIRTKYHYSLRLLLVFSAIVALTSLLPKQVKFGYEFEKGKVWLNKDLVAPYDFAILKTPEQLAADRSAILKNVLPVYSKLPNVQQDVSNAFSTRVSTILADSALTDPNQAEHLSQYSGVLTKIYTTGLLRLNGADTALTSSKLINVVAGNVSEPAPVGRFYQASTAYSLSRAVIFRQGASLAPVYQQAFYDVLKPDIVANNRLSQVLKNNALQSLSTTTGLVSRGEIIVAKGMVIDDGIYQRLLSYRNTYNSENQAAINNWVIWLGHFILVSLLIGLLLFFIRTRRPEVYGNLRKLFLILGIIITMLGILAVALHYNISSVYFLPYCIVPIIIRILFDNRLAITLHLLVTLIAALFVANSFEFALYQLTTGVIAVYSLQNFTNRVKFLQTGAYILGGYLLIFLGLSLLHEGNLGSIEWQGFIPFTLSVVLCLLSYPVIYAFERIFGITSDVSLIELSNTTNQLLRELAYKAPGTFQHSMQVANLAEAAIFKIGGNSLLTRTAALYHDIGKIPHPQYFIENQSGSTSPHDTLPSEESARVIIRHVADGVEIAHKAQLPESIINFIKTHHGTTRVDYFYQQYLKSQQTPVLDDTAFRYPGPRPSTREAGVLMLADSVEAASRSLKDPNAEKINNLVDRIIDYKLEQHQLDDCDLTLKDINNIKLIFKNMLMSIHHIRIDYPIAG